MGNYINRKADHDALEVFYLNTYASSRFKDLQPNAIHDFWMYQGDPDGIRKTQTKIMLQHMDTRMDPCKDFYKYACGNWEAMNPIPPDKNGFDTFEMLKENMNSVLKSLMEDRNHVCRMTFSKSCRLPSSNLKLFNGRLMKKLSMKENYFKKYNSEKDTIATSILIKEDLKDECETNILHFSSSRHSTRGIPLKYAIRNIPINKNINVPPNNAYTLEQNENIELRCDNSANWKAKYLYDACMDTDTLAIRRGQPLKDLIHLLGGWPLLEQDWKESNFDWLDLTAKIRLFYNGILISEWVGPDLESSNKNIIQFDTTTLGLPTKEYYIERTNSKYLIAYKNYLIAIVRLMGGNLQKAMNDINDIIKFETKLAYIAASGSKLKMYKRLSLHELGQIIPSINWLAYLQVISTLPKDDSEVIVYALNYFKHLSTLISRTDSRVINNYLMWRFVLRTVDFLDISFQDAKQNFINVLFGREESPPRWKYCIAQVNSKLGMVLGSMFVKKYFDESSKNDTVMMTKMIMSAFKSILMNKEWIDDNTKFLAKEKLDAMLLRIGYPNFLLHNADLDKRYQDVSIYSDTYFEDMIEILLHLTEVEHDRFWKPVNKKLWETVPTDVNAYYSRDKNQIIFPAGILQPPFYHRYFPKSLNFGGIGVVIGHEITHGFDNKGRLYDKHGNLHRWWNHQAIKEFDRRAECIVKQYSHYTMSDVKIHLDGINTEGENIADNGGIKEAFIAYMQWLKENPCEDETLPGLNLTNYQLFFLNFAQIWCGSMRPEAARNELKISVHSPGMFRVLGTLSNSQDFAHVYNCPSGTRMNPKRKCHIW